jgi:acyl-CoA synthetase (AMP-forming)/AMP-acid ligase II
MKAIQEILSKSTLNKLAIVTDTTEMSYSELYQRSLDVGLLLLKRGVKNGDRVVIMLDNDWKWIAAFFGTLLIGGIAVPISNLTRDEKLDYICKDCDAKYILRDSDFIQLNTAFSDGIAKIKERAPHHEAVIIYTSGTTGESKGVIHSHKSVLFALDAIVDYLELDESDKLFSVLPLNFGYGLLQMLSAFKVGATLHLEKSFAYQSKIFNQMKDATYFAGVPTMFSLIIAANEETSLSFPNIKTITNAAAALPVKYIPKLKSIFPNAKIFSMYGQTECFRTAYLDPELIETKPESVGKAMKGTEIRLLDENLNPVAVGEPGMLYVSGLHVMMGYWNKLNLTKETLVEIDGKTFLKSGDLFKQDANGDLTYVSRDVDIIKIAGKKVSAMEITNIIHKIPEIEDVFVTGVPDEILGERIIAVVSAKNGKPIYSNQVRKFCLRYLEPYMVPQHVFILDKFPRTENGKFSKSLILQSLKELTHVL